MGCRKSGAKREVYSNMSLPQETRETSNKQPNPTPKETRKRRTKNPKVSCCSVAKLCLFATPWTAARQGFPVLHHLPEFAQT